MRRGRLLYVVTSDVSMDVLLRGQLAAMRQQGWVVEAVSGGGERLAKVASREGVSVHHVPMEREISPGADLRSLLKLWRHLSSSRPDVVNYGTPKAALLTSMASWLRRVPRRVYVIRGLRYEGVTGRRRRLLIGAERIASGLATDVVAVSPSVARAYRRDVDPRRPIGVVGLGSSNGVRGRALPDAEAVKALRERYVATGDRMVLFVGRHHEDKGFDDLLGALVREETRDCVLVSVGPVEGALPSEAAHLAEEGRWHHVPWADDPQLFMAAADVLVLPTRREGFSNVLVEAQLMGTPVIANDVTGTGDAMRAGETGLLARTGDVRGLASAIAALVGDPERRHRMGMDGRQWVTDEFAPERVWAGLDAIYRGQVPADSSWW